MRTLENDRANWWVRVAEGIELAAASGNSQILFKLLHSTGGQRTLFNEIVSEEMQHPFMVNSKA